MIVYILNFISDPNSASQNWIRSLGLLLSSDMLGSIHLVRAQPYHAQTLPNLRALTM